MKRSKIILIATTSVLTIAGIAAAKRMGPRNKGYIALFSIPQITVSRQPQHLFTRQQVQVRRYNSCRRFHGRL